MRRVYISEKDRKIFGICGGIGETYDIDPTLIRAYPNNRVVMRPSEKFEA